MRTPDILQRFTSEGLRLQRRDFLAAACASPAVSGASEDAGERSPGPELPARFRQEAGITAKPLNNRTAIITGAARGFGFGIATVLARQGADVWITDRDAAALAAAASRLHVQAIRADVTVPADWDAVFARLLSERNKLDILVNNAGAGIRIAPTAEQSDADLLASVAVNLSGAMLGCRRAAPIMAKQGSGTIINVSSACAKHAWPGWAAYSGAKAGVEQFSRCLQTELRMSGVRVTTLAPSWGNTGFMAAAHAKPLEPEQLKRAIQPEELGELVATICALPVHLTMQEMNVWPLVQEIVPL